MLAASQITVLPILCMNISGMSKRTPLDTVLCLGTPVFIKQIEPVLIDADNRNDDAAAELNGIGFHPIACIETDDRAVFNGI